MPRPLRLRHLARAATLIVGSLAAGAGAADPPPPHAEPVRLHASPNGSPDADGRSAPTATTLGRALRLVATGDRPMHLVLSAGTYDMAGESSTLLRGRPGAPLVIEGEGPATDLVGTYRPGERPGPALFVLARSDVTIRNLSVRNVARFLDVAKTSAAERIVVAGIRIAQVHDGILIDRGRSATARDWLIEDVSVTGHERVGIRLASAGTSHVVIRRASIDGLGDRAPSTCFKGGIQLLQGVADVTIEDTIVRDNVGCPQQAYQQGDGIEADDRGGAPVRITLRNVTSTGNRDGNFDLKARDMVLDGLVAGSTGASRHGFRFWNYAYRCVRCRLEGAGADAQLVNADLTMHDPPAMDSALTFTCADRRSRPSSVYRIVREGGVTLEATCPPPSEPDRLNMAE